MRHEDWSRVPAAAKLRLWSELNAVAALLHQGSLDKTLKTEFLLRHRANLRIAARLADSADGGRPRTRRP